MLRTTKAVIFDMDGVLIDSETYWHQVNSVDMYGHSFTEEMERAIVGLNHRDMNTFLKNTYGLEIDVDEVFKKEDYFGKRIYGIQTQLCEGVSELIDRLYARGVTLAVASSSQTKWIEMALGRFGLRDKFETLVSTTTDNLVGKPDPAVYVEAMKRLGVSPQETIIIEDSQHGFDAAKASGARVIAVPHALTKHGDFLRAALVVETLADTRVFECIGIS